MTNNLPRVNFRIPELPLWKGVLPSPTVETFPFELSWDYDGFIRQTTESSVLEEITGAYSRKDYKFISPPPGSSDWGNELATLYLDKCLEHIDDLDNKHILEIGAGTTGFAQLLKARFNVASYTIVDPAIQDEIPDIRIIRNFFPCEEALEQSYDLIISLNTAEHVANVSLFLESLRKLLDRRNHDGMVFISLPDAGSQMLSGDLSVLLHEHLNYFSVDLFEQFIANKGFVTKHLSIASDSIFASLSLMQPGKKRDRSGTIWNPIFLEGVNRITTVLQEFGNRLEDLAKTGSLVFHGATPGLNSFLFLTGLGNCAGISITDGDQEKYENYLPAHDRPIVSPKETLYREADLIVISAPSFKEPIESYIRERASRKPIVALSYDGLAMLDNL